MSSTTIKSVLLLSMLCVCSTLVMGQVKLPKWIATKNDTNYVEDHSEELTTRLYSSRKYTYFNVYDKSSKKDLRYFTNTPANVGFGVNYRFIGLNIGFNLPFINKTDKYGKPKYLDLQTNIYLRKWIVDLYLQFYKNYYLVDPGNTLQHYVEDGRYARRPDMKSVDAGAGVTYVFNDTRFSYRANSLQIDYQKKSAGSFLLGGSALYVKMQGDSSIIPTHMQQADFLNGVQYDRSGTFQLTASAGYGYTLVVAKHFFLTGVVTLGIGANYNDTHFVDGHTEHGVNLALNDKVRLAVGYNSSKYFAGVHWENFDTHNAISGTNAVQGFGTGNLRVSLVRRFGLKKQLWKVKYPEN